MGEEAEVVIEASVIGLPSSHDDYADRELPSSTRRKKNATSTTISGGDVVSQVEPVREEIAEDIQRAICDITRNLVKQMGIDVECTYELKHNLYMVSLNTEVESDQPMLIGKHGKNIESLQKHNQWHYKKSN